MADEVLREGALQVDDRCVRTYIFWARILNNVVDNLSHLLRDPPSAK